MGQLLYKLRPEVEPQPAPMGSNTGPGGGVLVTIALGDRDADDGTCRTTLVPQFLGRELASKNKTKQKSKEEEDGGRTPIVVLWRP